MKTYLGRLEAIDAELLAVLLVCHGGELLVVDGRPRVELQLLALIAGQGGDGLGGC